MPKKKISEHHAQVIAESLLPSFIPKDPGASSLSFNFTAEGAHFEARFEKAGKEWKLVFVKEDEHL